MQGDRFFQKGEGENSFHLPSISPHFPQHAKTFMRAADRIVDAHFSESNRMGHEDHLLFPVVYLYRHSLELAMKGTIQGALEARLFCPATAQKLTGRPPRRGRALLSSHELIPLWEAIREVVEKVDDGNLKAPAEAFGSMISELDGLDKDGQTLRYDRDRSGKLNHDKFDVVPDSIDVINLRVRTLQMHNFLGGIDWGIGRGTEF